MIKLTDLVFITEANIGDVLTHRTIKGLTITLLQSTSRGWKVKQVDSFSPSGTKLNKPKEKIAFFDKTDMNMFKLAESVKVIRETPELELLKWQLQTFFGITGQMRKIMDDDAAMDAFEDYFKNVRENSPRPNVTYPALDTVERYISKYRGNPKNTKAKFELGSNEMRKLDREVVGIFNKIKPLLAKRRELEFEQEQTAEPHGGPIANRIGTKLEKIDKVLEPYRQKVAAIKAQTKKEYPFIKFQLQGIDFNGQISYIHYVMSN